MSAPPPPPPSHQELAKPVTLIMNTRAKDDASKVEIQGFQLDFSLQNHRRIGAYIFFGGGTLMPSCGLVSFRFGADASSLLASCA